MSGIKTIKDVMKCIFKPFGWTVIGSLLVKGEIIEWKLMTHLWSPFEHFIRDKEHKENENANPLSSRHGLLPTESKIFCVSASGVGQCQIGTHFYIFTILHCYKGNIK